jgi:hypothetical protein
MDVSNTISGLVLARRLMIMAQEMADERNGKKVTRKTVQEAMQEDQVLISGEQPDAAEYANPAQAAPQPQAAAVEDLNLSDLIRRLDALRAGDPPAAVATAVAVEIRQEETTEISMQYTSLERVDGLVLRSKHLAETDRYALEFSDGVTFQITDKWSGRSTRIWGDPHVDTDDEAGDRNGEFSDLKGSNDHTTLMLQDGTRVTFTAKDDGVIERVDIFKDGQHLGGLGEASKEFNEQTGLFAGKVDRAAAAGVPAGDTIYAGGDGNDWFSAAGVLLWGKTTGPQVTERPASVLEMSYRRTLVQSVSVASVSTQA